MFTRSSSTHKSSPGLLSNPNNNSSSSNIRPHPLSLCADCGTQGPSWASINRGVLLCSDCTSVHRSLGRHISHVKSLRGGSHWIPEQLTMVQSLYSCGANSIWEYSLLNPISSKGGRRKPSSSDPLHPVKSDFINAKYQQLAFVYKPAKDEPAVSQSDLSKQLHSSVRTPNLETSLRLISQGADPNYYHPEKNSTPLQVAARAGQSGQIELLLVYGADPGAVDKMGRTAAEYAKQAGYSGVKSRLVNSQFELPDRLTFFLCQRKPDHANNVHFIIPEIEQNHQNADERKIAKRKMQGLNNSVFEELAMDVFDEVDRRETDEIWSAVEKSSKSVIIPFLPVNPEYGTTRNQGRQKLARLNATEFAILVLDVLKEIKRRQTEMNSRWPKMPSPLRETGTGTLKGLDKVVQTKSLPLQQRYHQSAVISDDEPIYDHVAEDDDYYHIPESDNGMGDKGNNCGNSKRPLSSTDGISRQDSRRSHDAMATGVSSFNSSPSKSNNTITTANVVGPQEFREIKAQLNKSEFKVQRLIESNEDMRGEIARLSVTVNKLVNENEQLRYSISPTHTFNNVNNHNSSSASNLAASPLKTSTSSRQQTSGPNSFPFPSGGTNYMTLPSRGVPGRPNPTPQAHSQFYEPYNNFNNVNHHPSSSASASLPYTMPPQTSLSVSNASLGQSPKTVVSSHHSVLGDVGGGYAEIMTSPTSSDQSLPSQEEVVRRTEAITRCIQELLISAKEEEFDAFIPCSERIVRAVTDMVILFPEEPIDSSVSASLSSLTAAATHFETECRILIMRSQTEPLNQSFVTQQVIQCAFDIAKATKQLVALFQ